MFSKSEEYISDLDCPSSQKIQKQSVPEEVRPSRSAPYRTGASAHTSRRPPPLPSDTRESSQCLWNPDECIVGSTAVR